MRIVTPPGFSTFLSFCLYYGAMQAALLETCRTGNRAATYKLKTDTSIVIFGELFFFQDILATRN